MHRIASCAARTLPGLACPRWARALLRARGHTRQPSRPAAPAAHTRRCGAPVSARAALQHLLIMSALVVPAPVDCLPNPYLAHPRPWLALYGVLVRPRPGIAAAEEADLALIQRVLPDEMLFNVFAALGPYHMGRAACVCRQWRAFSENPKHWEAACRAAFTAAHKTADMSRQALLRTYRGSWRRLFLGTPHVRYDGLYVSRNTYVRQGVAEWRRQHNVYLVTYFRYFRFFPDGTLLYRTSPHTVAKVAPTMQRQPVSTAKQKDDHVFSGRFVIKGPLLYVVVLYPNSRMTEVRSRLRLRSTVPGANNRLDVEAIYSYDRELGAPIPYTAPDEDPADGDGVRKDYQRGLASCMFVPWEAVATSVLNLHAKDMDFFMTG